MKAQWFSIAMLAALVIGYSILSGRDDDSLDNEQQQSVLLGYYVRGAIITETAESGAPRVRFAASEVSQNTDDDSVSLTAVRADYLWPAKDEAGNGQAKPNDRHATQPVNHWVLNADRARLSPKSKQSTERIELHGNVEAHNVAALHSAALSTQSLEIDTEQQVARTPDAVRVDVDGHTANGRGLLVDMQKNHVQLQSGGTLRVAARPNDVARDPGSLSLPDVFEWDSLNFKDNIFVLTKVRSKAEPFISADQARATGDNLANNQFVFSGAVRLELPNRGLLTADSATVTVRSNRIVFVQLAGESINFQHQRSNDQIIYGRATAIDYDVPAQILRIPGQAWFRLDRFEWQQEATEYNLATGEARGKQGKGTAAEAKTESKPEPKSEPK